MTKNFDQATYWISRHREYAGDPRSVGNMAASTEANYEGEKALVSVIATLAEALPARRVIDLGCGYGRTAGPFLARGCSYTGIDVSPEAIAAARVRHPGGEFLVQDLAEWRPADRYDVVLALYVMVHFVDDARWQAFLQTAMAATRPGGVLVIADDFPTETRRAGHYVARPFSEYRLPGFSRHIDLENALMHGHHGQAAKCAAQFRAFLRA